MNAHTMYPGQDKITEIDRKVNTINEKLDRIEHILQLLLPKAEATQENGND